MADRHPSIAPIHPGEVLAEDVIPATGRSKAEIARLLGISRQTLFDILAQRQPVTPQVAVRLGCGFGCRRRTTCGRPSARWTCRRSRDWGPRSMMQRTWVAGVLRAALAQARNGLDIYFAPARAAAACVVAMARDADKGPLRAPESDGVVKRPLSGA